MLVLSRKRGERIVIDPKNCPLNEQGLIEVELVDIRGDKARIGVIAERRVAVHRKEVWRAIQDGTKPEKGNDAA